MACVVVSIPMGEEAAIDSLTHLPRKSSGTSETNNQAVTPGREARLRPPARKDEHGGRADAPEPPSHHPAPRSGRHGGATPRPAPSPARLSAEYRLLRYRDGKEGTACKSAIFGRHLNLFPGYVEIRTQNKRIVPGKSSCIKRGKITEFSNKSANNYRKMVGRIPRGQHPTLWQDFTFCDLAMMGKVQKERAQLNTAVMHAFRKKVKRKYPLLWLVYRKEWEPRKSGALIGEELPHNHCLVGGIEEYGHPFTVAAELALMWVDCTHIVDKETYREALAVALHPKSYRFIENLTAALRYVTKYTGKLSDVHLEDAGRAWGRIGEVPQAEPIIEQMTDSEDMWFRRLVRRSLRKGKKGTSRARTFSWSPFRTGCCCSIGWIAFSKSVLRSSTSPM